MYRVSRDIDDEGSPSTMPMLMSFRSGRRHVACVSATPSANKDTRDTIYLGSGSSEGNTPTSCLSDLDIDGEITMEPQGLWCIE